MDKIIPSKKISQKTWPDDFPYRFFIGMHTPDYDQTPLADKNEWDGLGAMQAGNE